MSIVHYIAFSLLIIGCLSQRPSYAGNRPIGYPAVETTPSSGLLGNRFGDDERLQILPLDALNDRDLVMRISRLPLDKQPFWFINWRALEANRRTPQTYEQRQSPFNQPINQN
ncbi:PREDICTED: uncharacterized protein LOC106105108 [Papilio polytes]|uniref:uncharacterized protein LOC106105108 n=1 Tax=Papilio polytes TaxID=76194 RepID=UPI0006767886|nr:PREDICTED: uncharacterized protein LOC106105108 [Papilio polytes]XP_013140792.1 PREDICTED: uncharacterized protein LOC106105108 [Papilio polytes]XP_013140793.1 PREDICTED: uncharacterized protein LOC106105108 [Papilio polytes]